MSGTYLIMQRLPNLRRSSKDLDLSSRVASKLEVIRYVFFFFFGEFGPSCCFLMVCLLVSCSRDSLLALLSLKQSVPCRVHLRYCTVLYCTYLKSMKSLSFSFFQDLDDQFPYKQKEGKNIALSNLRMFLMSIIYFFFRF